MTRNSLEDVVQPSGVRRCGHEWRLLAPVPADGETAPRSDVLRHSHLLDAAWYVGTGLLAGNDLRDSESGN